MSKKNNAAQPVFWISVVLFSLFIFLSVRFILPFAEEKSPFVFEFYAAVLGALITVTAMAVLMKIQSQHEQEKEFSNKLFDKKIELYGALINRIFELDDDGYLDRQEISDIENQIGGCSLVASEDLVGSLAQFMFQLKVYGVVYQRNMNEKQLSHFGEFIEHEKDKKEANKSYLALSKWKMKLPIKGNEVEYFVSLDEVIQAIRNDLAVVKGNIEHDLELFTCTEYDKYKLMTNPNIID